MFETNRHRSKSRIEVELYLSDGTYLFGKVSVLPDERLSDLMNDEREFLPIENSQGTVLIVRKGYISKVVQLDQHIKSGRMTDPYEILGVTRKASNEEVAQRYYKISGENHPDKLVAAGVSEEFVRMANSRMARINDAYQRIMASRQKQDKAAPA